MNEVAAALAKMREPFPPNQISKLPKPLKRDAPKGKCIECGGWHGLPAIHLDYVGHAALTDRLLDADPTWTWEPATPDGLPALDKNNGMWIKLTVAGVTRLGYGSADGKSGGDAVKEVIGDALRNAAMRFGAALDLWHKGDLHADEADDTPPPREEVSRTTSQAPEKPSGDADKWVRTQINKFAGFDSFEKLSAHVGREAYSNLKDALKLSDPKLWQQVDDAERTATARLDDVPFA